MHVGIRAHVPQNPDFPQDNIKDVCIFCSSPNLQTVSLISAPETKTRSNSPDSTLADETTETKVSSQQPLYNHKGKGEGLSHVFPFLTDSDSLRVVKYPKFSRLNTMAEENAVLSKESRAMTDHNDVDQDRKNDSDGDNKDGTIKQAATDLVVEENNPEHESSQPNYEVKDHNSDVDNQPRTQKSNGEDMTRTSELAAEVSKSDDLEQLFIPEGEGTGLGHVFPFLIQLGPNEQSPTATDPRSKQNSQFQKPLKVKASRSMTDFTEPHQKIIDHHAAQDHEGTVLSKHQFQVLRAALKYLAAEGLGKDAVEEDTQDRDQAVASKTVTKERDFEGEKVLIKPKETTDTAPSNQITNLDSSDMSWSVDTPVAVSSPAAAESGFSTILNGSQHPKTCEAPNEAHVQDPSSGTCAAYRQGTTSNGSTVPQTTKPTAQSSPIQDKAEISDPTTKSGRPQTLTRSKTQRRRDQRNRAKALRAGRAGPRRESAGRARGKGAAA